MYVGSRYLDNLHLQCGVCSTSAVMALLKAFESLRISLNILVLCYCFVLGGMCSASNVLF